MNIEECVTWAGEMAQLLRALTAPLEDLSSVLSTCISNSQLLRLQFQGDVISTPDLSGHLPT